MAKKVQIAKNKQGGVDLITETEKNKAIRIKTGKLVQSIQYWHKLKRASDKALKQMNDTPLALHIIVINPNGYASTDKRVYAHVNKSGKRRIATVKLGSKNIVSELEVLDGTKNDKN